MAGLLAHDDKATQPFTFKHKYRNRGPLGTKNRRLVGVQINYARSLSRRDLAE